MNRTPETQADNLIDATLATLRTTPAPTGLEDRLLQSLEASQMRVPHVSNLRHGWIATILSQKLWAGTALAATILAITFAVHLHHRSNPTQASTNAAVELPRNTTVPVEQQPTVVIPRHVAHFPAHPLFLSIPQRSGGTCISPPDCTAAVKNANYKQPPTPYELAALEDALAPSHPAPPLPLTHQERLLLRCTRRGQLIQVAELDLTHEQEIRATTANRDAASLQQYVKGLLHTLVGFQPPEPAPPTDEPSPTPTPAEQAEQPTSSH